MRKIYVVMFLSLLAVFSNRSIAQWEQLNIPTAGSGNSVNSMLAIGHDVYASTPAGFFTSADAGINWTRKDTVAYMFTTMAHYNGLIYGGYYMYVLRSSNEGTTWEYVSGSPGGSINASIYKLYEFHGNLYACVRANAGGTSPGLYVSTNGGTFWVPRGTGLPANAEVSSITSIDTVLFVVALGSSGRKVYRSYDGGMLWELLTLPTLRSADQIVSIQNFLFCLFPSSGFDGGQIATSADSGTTWSLRTGVGPPVHSTTSFIRVDNDLFFTTGGGASPSETPVMRSVDNGESFVSFVDGLPSPYQLYTKDIIASPSYLYLTTSLTNAWRRPNPNNPVDYVISSPSAGELLLAGSKHDIIWSGHGITSLNIHLSTDSGASYSVIAQGVQADAGQYEWSVPSNIVSSKCIIRLVDASNPAVIFKSAMFKCKNYVLTRYDQNGDFEKFLPPTHGWQMRNDSANMWPQPWWSQFNYQNGTDPYTQQPYPPLFGGGFIAPYKFVDWPLFVRSFGTTQCYIDQPTAQYSALAIRLWLHVSRWDGSCAGFAASSLMAFDDKTVFQSHYPELGAFTHLFDLTTNDDTRGVINLLWARQLGVRHTKHRRDRDFVRTTLQKIKDMFLSEDRNDAFIALRNYSGFNHAVVPVELERTGQPGQFWLYTYDSNFPYLRPKLFMDSLNQNWYTTTYNFSRSDGFGLDLDDPASSYYTPDDLWDPSATASSTTSISAAPTSTMRVFTTRNVPIVISDTFGNTIGFRDSATFNSIPGADPIELETGGYSPPIGFIVPSGSYTVVMDSIPDTTAILSAIEGSRMFTFWRNGITIGQTDHVLLNNGLIARNSDSEAKIINLESITRYVSGERVFQILNCQTMQNDSVRIANPDSNRLEFTNWGTQKTYDLNIELSSQAGAGNFHHAAVTVPANSSQTIVPDWQNLGQQTVKILIDDGNNGTIDDSIIVTNQTTGVPLKSTGGIPHTFALEQNYPNPFNPSTKIGFKIQVSAFTSLKVYDVLGRDIATLVNEMLAPGTYSTTWDAINVPSGVYYYRITSTGTSKTFSEVKKMMLVK